MKFQLKEALGLGSSELEGNELPRTSSEHNQYVIETLQGGTRRTATMKNTKSRKDIRAIVVFGLIGVLAFCNIENPFGFIRKKDKSSARVLSIDLGSGQCEWTNPVELTDGDTSTFKTLITGYPGSGKKSTFMQLEGMTGLATADDWSHHNSPDRAAFVKTSYPHHEGVWSFSDKMDQVVLIIRNPRWAIPSYHTIRFEMDYADDWASSNARVLDTYTKRPPSDRWIEWRDNHFDKQMDTWSWWIDFWMEGGLQRVKHNVTGRVKNAIRETKMQDYEIQVVTGTEEVTEFDNVTNTTITYTANITEPKIVSIEVPDPTYDMHCIDDMDCEPKAIVFYERISDPQTGPSELNELIASAVDGKAGIEVLSPEAQACVFEELALNGKGANYNPSRNTNGPHSSNYLFTPEQLDKMLTELTRLRDKYSAVGEDTDINWPANPLAQKLVNQLNLYIIEVEQEKTTGAVKKPIYCVGPPVTVPASTLTSAPVNGMVDYDITNNLAHPSNGALPAVAKETQVPKKLNDLVVAPGYVNDGKYGNHSSWVSIGISGWVKIDLGQCSNIMGIKFGRDRLAINSDRQPGQIKVFVADADNVYADGDGTFDINEYTLVYDSTCPYAYSGLLGLGETLEISLFVVFDFISQ